MKWVGLKRTLSEGLIRVQREGVGWRGVKVGVAVGGTARAEEGDQLWVRGCRLAQSNAHSELRRKAVTAEGGACGALRSRPGG